MHSSHIKWDVSQKQNVHRKSRKLATGLAQSSFCTLQVAGAPQRPCLVGLSEIGAEGQKVEKSKLVTFFLL